MSATGLSKKFCTIAFGGKIFPKIGLEEFQGGLIPEPEEIQGKSKVFKVFKIHSPPFEVWK